jgi:SAM-dependent methyltransferase
MSSYVGRHAELYDLFYADKPYADEAAAVDRLLLQHAGYSPDMLARARQRGEAAGSRVEFLQADMRTLDFGERRFDAAVCLFDAIGYVATNEAVRQVFEGVRRHVRPGGVFVFEFWHAAAMLRSFEPTRVRSWRVPDGEILRISSTRLEPDRQLAHVTYRVLELGSDGRFAELTETQINRYFLVQEMAALLHAGGLEPVAWFDGFSGRTEITCDTWHVLAVARVP